MTTRARQDARRPLRVLVVDDEPLVRRFMTRLIGRLVEHVDVAADGQEALEFIMETDEPLHLVLSDLSMPRLNGIELARRLHQLEHPPPVVLMTAFDPPEVHDLLEQGILADFLRKPMPLPRIIEAIERHALPPRGVA